MARPATGPCRAASARAALLCSSRRPSRLPEREHVRLGAALEEADLDGPIANAVVLPDELVHATGVEHAVALLVDVEAVRAGGDLAVEEDAERNRPVCSA